MREFQLVRNEGIDKGKTTSHEGKDEIHIILNIVPEEMWLQVFQDRWNGKKPKNCDLHVKDHYLIMECASKDREANLDLVQECIALANIKYTILYEDEEKQEELEEKRRDKE